MELGLVLPLLRQFLHDRQRACFAATAFCWLYMLKRYPFSMVYPMLSLAYVMGMLAAVVFFHEQIPLTRWIGIALIMAGCVLIAK